MKLSERKIRVLLADSHSATRLGLKIALKTESYLEVVGEAGTTNEAWRLTTELKPDLIVLEFELNSDSGLELCRKIKASPITTRILFYTDHNSPGEISSYRQSRADGYVHKCEDLNRVRQAIERICSNGECSNGECSNEEQWLMFDKLPEVAPQLIEAREYSTLTAREEEVFALLLKRRTNHEIAAELCISSLTAKTHVRNVLGKLGFRSRREIS